MPAPHSDHPAGLLPALLDRAAGLVHRHPGRAERLAHWVERRIDLGATHEDLARAKYLRAQLLTERGELDGALQLIGEARDLWTRDENALAALRTDLGRMHVLDDLGRHQEAMEVGERLVDGLGELCAWGPNDEARYLRAHAVKNLGVAYGLVGRHAHALEAYARAGAEYGALGKHEETARPLANTGLELLALGRPAEALTAFDQAIEIFEAADDPVFAAQCRGDAAQAHRQLGQIGPALQLLEEARGSLERLGATTEAVRLRLALAQTHLAVGLWAEARDAASSAAVEAARSSLRHDEAKAYFLLGLCDLAANRCSSALDQLTTARTLMAEVDDRQHLARVELARAEALFRLGRTTEARDLVEKCSAAMEEGGWQVPLVAAGLLRADLTDDVDDAEARLRALADLVGDLDLPELSYEHELRTARVLRAQGRLDLAADHLGLALVELERAAGAVPDYALLTSFRSHRSEAHGELVEVLLARAGPEDVRLASLVANDVRARTLADLLARAAGTGPVLAAGGRELGAAFAELSEQYLAEETTAREPHRSAATARSVELERRVSSLRMRHLGPDSSPAGLPARTDARRVPVPTLAYHVSGDDLLVFVHCDDAVRVRRLPDTVERLHRLLDDLDDQWSRAAIAATRISPGSAGLVRSVRATLRSLHDVLVEPVADHLVDVGPRLCVVADGRMGTVPFGVLFDGESYLFERWTITLAPSVLFGGTGDLTVRPQARVTVVGVADDDAPLAVEEARGVAGRYPGAVLLDGPAATVARLTEAAAGADVVHVACHGLHQPRNPLFSRLRLHDRWMPSAEIVQLELDGALVVLSACQSGSHGRDREPVGLAWAFLAAGAAGVVVSQWHVADEATASVMASLHAGLAAGLSADEALRSAQTRAASAELHPYFWGAFALVASPLRGARGVSPTAG